MIILTGACGFIGSGCVRYLNDLGIFNLVLVDEALEHPSSHPYLLGKKYLTFVAKSDLLTWLQGREKEISAIIHLGACSDTTECDAAFLKSNNLDYSIRLAQVALAHRLRFIYASSAATYGDGSLGFHDDHEHLRSLQPLNLYGWSKHNFDLWLQENGYLDRVVGLKYFNVFGPNENHKGHMASMIYKMLPMIRSQGYISLFRSTDQKRFADGEQVRDFIYVKDAVRMTCGFLENEICGIFNIGSGVATKWKTLAGALFKALDMTPQITYVEMPETLKNQYQNYTKAQMHKYHTLCGDMTQYTLEEGVKEYVVDHLLAGKSW